MKKTLTSVVVFLAGAFAVYSQDAVSFGNYASGVNYIYVSLGSTRLGGSATGPSPTIANFASETSDGNDWTVALYGNAGINDAGSDLAPLKTADGTPVTATLEVGNPAVDNYLGTWYSTAVGVIPGATGPEPLATIQVYAWYNDGGTINSYAAAFAAGVPTGFSATENAVFGGPVSGPYTSALVSLGNITLTVATPEPSAIALAMIGASAFLLRLRLKPS